LAAVALPVLVIAAIGLARGQSTSAQSATTCTGEEAPQGATPGSIIVCNETNRSVDGLQVYITTPFMHMAAHIDMHDTGCAHAATDLGGSGGPDFSFTLKITWDAVCVDPGESVRLDFSCRNSDTDTPVPCLSDVGCAEWLLGGLPVGPPCEPLDCGGVPCCSHVPCPTAHPGTDADFDGVPDANDNCPAVPNPYQLDHDADGIGDFCEWPVGDMDCDFFVGPLDALAGLTQSSGALLERKEGCPEFGGGSPHKFGDLDCSDGFDAADTLPVLRYFAHVPTELPADCPAIGS
jgi:hypothetical protein